MDQDKSMEQMRTGFKYLNKFMLLIWRLGLGNWLNMWPEGVGQIMVLTHTGRKTGIRRRTPVNFAVLNNEVYCLAGFGEVTDWYQNVLQNPQIEVWLPDGWWAGLIEEVHSSEEIFLQAMRDVMIASGFAGRMVGLDARTCTDIELAEFCRSYRLLRIRRLAARTGSDGPGDLAWVWPLATFLLLPLALRPRHRRR